MFVHFGPATWQGHEYDDLSTPLSQINPTKLDTDQWCRTAKSWGAKQIIFVAKHAGGFCWWQTQTSDYSIRNTPWKDGKGDVLADLSKSCRKHRLALGVYLFPGDPKWGADNSSGGRTKDPAKQAGYNKVFRQQLTELLTNYGQMREVWFDGSCVIDVNDILREHAKHAVIFQGPMASIRWPGTESGKIGYPAWNTLKQKDLLTGVATQQHDDPNGDAWAPHEADTPLYDHNWFWKAENEAKRKPLSELMDIYLKSVGYGAVMLLNSTPNTDGLIPTGDQARYQEFGDAIQAAFGHPVATVARRTGNEVALKLPFPSQVDCIEIKEDYREGHRIRAYRVDGKVNGSWKAIAEGSAVGYRRLQLIYPEVVSEVRLVITDSVGKPKVRRFAVHQTGLKATGVPVPTDSEVSEWTGTIDMNLDLSPWVTRPGVYQITFAGDEPSSITLNGFIGQNALRPEFLIQKSAQTWELNRTEQTTPNTPTRLYILAHVSKPTRILIRRLR